MNQKIQKTKQDKGNDQEIVAVLHNIRSSYNVGSIFRTADGLGLSKIYLTGYTPDPVENFHKISKIALGAEKNVKWEKKVCLSSLLVKLRREGFYLIGIEKTLESEDLIDFRDKQKKLALFFGNEKKGLSKQLLRKMDKVLAISMRGKKESFNVAIAFALSVFWFKN